jgi:hypothetical protein
MKVVKCHKICANCETGYLISFLVISGVSRAKSSSPAIKPGRENNPKSLMFHWPTDETFQEFLTKNVIDGVPVVTGVRTKINNNNNVIE